MFKNVSLPFTVTANSNSLIKTGVYFSSQDIGTAKLTFTITKDNVPLPLSGATGKLTMVMADKSKFTVAVSIDDPVNGIMSYVLSDDMLKHYGVVSAELDLYYNNQSAISVSQFTFNISQSLVDQDIVPTAEYYIDDMESFKAMANSVLQDISDGINQAGQTAQTQIDLINQNQVAKQSDLEATNAQLAEDTEQLKNVKAPYKYVGAIATFIDDDASRDFIRVLQPVFDARNIKATIAVITANVGTGSAMTVDELKSLQDSGYDIVSHTKTHSSSYFRDSIASTADSVYDDEFGSSQQWMKNNGFNGWDCIVYPYGGWTGDNAVRLKRLASKYYSIGVNAVGSYNISPVDNIFMSRIFLNKNTDISVVQAQIDDTVAKNAWIIFGTHSWDSANIDADYVGQVLDYLISKGVPILPLKEAEKIKGNVVSAGEFTQSGFFVGKDGSTNLSNNLAIVKGDYQGSMDDSISFYAQYKTTIVQIPKTKDSLTSAGGVMSVYRGDKYYSYAIFNSLNGKNSYLRTWNEGLSAWNAWQLINEGMKVISGNYTGSMDDPITLYDKYEVTVSQITSAKDTLTGLGGVMEIYHGDAYYSYAKFYTSDGQRMFRRRWNEGTSSWDTWIEYLSTNSPGLKVITGVVNSSSTRTMDDSITTYTQYQETVIHIDSTKDSYLGVGGIMKVYRGEPHYSYAEFRPATTNTIHMRKWNEGTNSWGSWSQV